MDISVKGIGELSGHSKDLSGMTFGKWKILSLDHFDRNSNYWLCECECGVVKSVRASALLQEKSTQCGLCSRRENGKKNRKEFSYVATTNLFYQYKSQARSRDLSFELTREEFSGLIAENCYYCGLPPSNVYTSYTRKNEAHHYPFLYTGVDRVDNTKGYSLDNCKPCCAHCNYAKSNLTETQFLDWVHSIFIHRLAGVSLKSAGVLADELVTTDIKCFMAQEKIMDSSLDDAARKEAALQTQKLNKRRNEVIKALDVALGQPDISPTEKTY